MGTTIQAPSAKQTATLLVAVRCRPLIRSETSKNNVKLVHVNDNRAVFVRDPECPGDKAYLDAKQNRSKERQFVFDIAFDEKATNAEVYGASVAHLVEGVLNGLNATVFAYGATGSGKTHTMVGSRNDPGLMVRSLETIFSSIAADPLHDFDVSCSYLEVYNEVIYDLLDTQQQALELREDPEEGTRVAGIRKIKVNSAGHILELLREGNNRRKTEATDANATSSRSHAVLEIVVRKTQKNHYQAKMRKAKLCLVDLAGSERASETNNRGKMLTDGANINRSLLALANCINALGKQKPNNGANRSAVYVPYRNSKLTRLLKDGLSGNSRTAMLATVSSSADQYHHTVNTLKYADRAKEIKTHVHANVGTVESHVTEYQRMIDSLQDEVAQLRGQLQQRDAAHELSPTASVGSKGERSEDFLPLLENLSQEINENVEERINLQKKLYEIDDSIALAAAELENLQRDEKIGTPDNDRAQQEIIEHTRENEEAQRKCQAELKSNEQRRTQLQEKLRCATSGAEGSQNRNLLRVLSQYRLQGAQQMELQYEIALRDEIIVEQRKVVDNLWTVLKATGLSKDQISALAAQHGIRVENLESKAEPLLSPPFRRNSPKKSAPFTGGSRRKMRISSLPEQKLSQNVNDQRGGNEIVHPTRRRPKSAPWSDISIAKNMVSASDLEESSEGNRKLTRASSAVSTSLAAEALSQLEGRQDVLERENGALRAEMAMLRGEVSKALVGRSESSTPPHGLQNYLGRIHRTNTPTLPITRGQKQNHRHSLGSASTAPVRKSISETGSKLVHRQQQEDFIFQRRPKNGVNKVR